MAETAFLLPIFITFFAYQIPIPTRHHQVALFSFYFESQFVKSKQKLLAGGCWRAPAAWLVPCQALLLTFSMIQCTHLLDELNYS